MEHSDTHAHDKAAAYAELLLQARGLLADERNLIANAANFSALIFNGLPDISWCGFYFAEPDGSLVVGPFQGRPACVRLAAGRGVCGAAIQTREIQVVADVATFPDHIYCDGQAQSEIVVPLFKADHTPLGVWDVDSYRPARFDTADRDGMALLCAAFMAASA